MPPWPRSPAGTIQFMTMCCGEENPVRYSMNSKLCATLTLTIRTKFPDIPIKLNMMEAP